MNILFKRTKETWNNEYATGRWDYLDSSIEKGRQAIIGMYCSQLFPEGRILDIGCGEGILFDFLNDLQRSRYMGIDISDEAIARARQKRNAFVQVADAETFESADKFDVIVFNEVIYYMDHKKAFERYLKLLNDDGVMILSMYRNSTWLARLFESGIRKASRRFFQPFEQMALAAKAEKGKIVWNLDIMKKKSSAQSILT